MLVFVFVSLKEDHFNKCLTSTCDGWSLGWSSVGGPAGCLSLPVTTSVFQHLHLPASTFCLWSLSLSPLRSPNQHSFSHPATLCLSLPSLFSALSSLPMSPAGCLSVSETKQTESCVSGLVTPRSWETGSSQRSTAASSFAGHVRHSPDISRRLRSLFLYSELTLCLFGRLRVTEAKWDTLSGYELEA